MNPLASPPGEQQRQVREIEGMRDAASMNTGARIPLSAALTYNFLVTRLHSRLNDGRAVMVTIKKIAFVLFVLLLFGIAGENDYQAALESEQRYKQRVCDGLHNDYMAIGVDCDR